MTPKNYCYPKIINLQKLKQGCKFREFCMDVYSFIQKIIFSKI